MAYIELRAWVVLIGLDLLRQAGYDKINAMTTGGRIRVVLALALALVVLTGVCLVSYRTILLHWLFGVDAPLGPFTLNMQTIVCHTGDESLDEQQLYALAKADCLSIAKTHCGGDERVIMQSFNTRLPSFRIKVPGCGSRSRALPMFDMMYSCLASPLSKWDSWVAEEYKYAGEETYF